MSVYVERLVNRIEIGEGGCWLWQGPHPRGYGRLRLYPSEVRVHRFSYEWFVGPIPEGLVIDHLCRVKHCVNPDHLEPVTNRVNILRGEGLAARLARQTHCKRGHPLDEANTYRDRRGGRNCKECQRLHVTNYRKRLRAKSKLTITPLPRSLKEVS